MSATPARRSRVAQRTLQDAERAAARAAGRRRLLWFGGAGAAALLGGGGAIVWRRAGADAPPPAPLNLDADTIVVDRPNIDLGKVRLNVVVPVVVTLTNMSRREVHFGRATVEALEGC